MRFKFTIECLFGLLLAVNSVSAQEKIKIGISTALTGNAATYGTDIQRAAIFANEKLGNGKYELVFEDDRCTGRDAVSVAQRFTSVLGIKYVLGFACSGTVLSTAPIYQQNKTLVMDVCGTAAEISHAGDLIFRTVPSDAFAAKKLYSYVAKLHKKFGIISEQTDYAQSFLKSFEKANDSAEVEIVKDSFLTEATDFRSTLQRMRGQAIEGLFINSQTELTLLAVLKQVRELGINVPIYTAYWGVSPTFIEKAGRLSEDVVTVDLAGLSETLNVDGLKLYEEFQQKFGKMNSIELVFATTFEGFRAVKMAIESGEDVGQFLSRTKFQGIFGDWSFDQNGDIIGVEHVLRKNQNGQAVLLN